MKLKQLLIVLFVTNHIITGECSEIIKRFTLFDFAYRCEKEDYIGKGQYGKVYHVQKVDTHTDFALKVQKIPNYENLLIKFGKNEVDALKTISANHDPEDDHVVRVYDTTEVDTTASKYIFYVMEYLPDGSFKKITERSSYSPEIPLTKIYEYIWHLLKGLVQMQEHKYVHLDIKPDNIMMRKQSYTNPLDCQEVKGEVPVYADFGFVEKIDTILVTSKGSPVYMAPEVIDRQTTVFHDGRIDVYSLGVTIYNLIYKGKYPFNGITESELIRKMKQGDYEINGETDFGLIFLISNMLVFEKRHRMEASRLLWYTEALLRLNKPINYSAKGIYTLNSKKPITVNEFWDKYGFNHYTTDSILAEKLPEKSSCHKFPIAEKPKVKEPVVEEVKPITSNPILERVNLKRQNSMKNVNAIGLVGDNTKKDLLLPEIKTPTTYTNIYTYHSPRYQPDYRNQNVANKGNLYFRKGRNKILI